ncbi:sensor histidine kinase [Smaragdicoccus niigatensis]|uniref:ATP-binding protein n=1 Tax=Smaragdicoccus niigatensis TaxID=359359 RepID=UPI00036AA389|nr:sensor histidine kinase [Smaragdicoccus niigatensis]
MTLPPAEGLVQTGIIKQAEVVALLMRNSAFALVAVVYLLQTTRSVAGVVLFGLLFVWSVWRLRSRDLSRSLLVADVAFVVAAALLESEIVPVTVADLSMASTRMIAYPVVVSVAIAQPKRWSFTIAAVISAASGIGDYVLFGAPSISTIAIFALNWWAATWVRRMVLRAGAESDAADALARRAQLREQVAAARIRFEREQFATLHDTAASTLLMVADTDVLDPHRLANQAARDIAILTEATSRVRSDSTVDLVACVEGVCAEFSTPVEVWSDGPVVVSQLIAAAVAAAVREALNNVDRHACATSVRVTVAPEAVTVTDDGVGFDPARASAGFGLRASIDARMRRAGGSSAVVSSPGAGTTVSLQWQQAPVDDDPEQSIDVSRVLRSYQYGLAAAQILVLTEMVFLAYGGLSAIGLGLPAAVIAMLAITGPIVVIAVRADLTPARWVWVIALSLLDHWYLAVLPTREMLTMQNWVSTSVGWATVAVFAGWVRSRQRVLAAATMVVTMWVIDSAIMVWRVPTSAVVEYAGYGLASIASMQVGALFFGWLLAEAVRRAELLGHAQLTAATHLAVEKAVQEDYRKRFERLTTEVVELLRGLADRSLSAGQPAVQERAQTEYARLRRLFAQADSFEHPLMQRLRPVFDAAAERGVEVTFDVQSRPPDLAERDIEPLAAAIDQLVQGSSDRVRLVVSSSDERVTVSVVSDCIDRCRAQASDVLAGTEFQLTVADRVTWLRVHLPVVVAA